MTHGISRRCVCSPHLSDAMRSLERQYLVVMLSLKRRSGGIRFHVFSSRDRDLDQMTFIYELDANEVYRMSENKLRTSRHSTELSSDRQT